MSEILGSLFAGFAGLLGDSISWLLVTVDSIDPVTRTVIAGAFVGESIGFALGMLCGRYMRASRLGR